MKDIVKYSERNGKNSGVMALKVIKPGTLILREKAQFNPIFVHGFDCHQTAPCKTCFENVMTTFLNMNLADQEEYLKLWNSSETEEGRVTHLKLKGTLSTMFPLSEVELVAHVCEIYHSFSTSTGEIAIKAYRFKHSCNANAMYYIDKEKDEHVVKAASKILCYEDIFINRCTGSLSVTDVMAESKILPYEDVILKICAVSGELTMKNLGTRRKILLEKFDFECHCDLCEIEELKGDNDRYVVYENLKIEIKNMNEILELMYRKNRYDRKNKELFERTIRCYRDMYKCAKECSAGRLFIIVDILIPGHDCARAACKFASSSNNNVLAELFKKDVESFAKAALQLGKTTFGKNSSYWKGVEERFKLVE